MQETLTLARIAGDEFIVFIPEIAKYLSPLRLGHEIQRLLLQPLIADNVSLEVSTTISVIIGGKEYTSVGRRCVVLISRWAALKSRTNAFRFSATACIRKR